MDLVRLKLEQYNIEWDGPIVVLVNNKVTILSPFRILSLVDNTSFKVRTSVYEVLRSLTSRKEILSYLERLGKRILRIKL